MLNEIVCWCSLVWWWCLFFHNFFAVNTRFPSTQGVKICQQFDTSLAAIPMIDHSQAIYYLGYALLCACLGVAYIKVKSTEGVVITTKEFKNFQNSFLTAYSLMIMCELMSVASFFHAFAFLKLSLEQITKLYVVTIFSTTAFGILVEIVDIGARKDKCMISAVLYSIGLVSMFFGGHFEMLLLGRVVYGAAAALQHSSFEGYVIHEHTSRGFPDDWLSQTFSFLTHSMAFVAAFSGTHSQHNSRQPPKNKALMIAVDHFQYSNVFDRWID